MVVSFMPSCFNLSQPPCHSKHISRHIASNIRRPCIRRPQILSSAHEDAVGLRVFVLSDLHTDYAENMKWVKSLSADRYKNDVLLVAGDVAETYNNFLLTMSLLKDRFEHVFYVPGNHDLWCRRDGEDNPDSLQKLNCLLDACRTLGVVSNPMIIDDLGIIPLLSWYHESFDREMDIPNIRIPSLEMVIHSPSAFWVACKDFNACKWPGELSNADDSLALYFDSLNDMHSDVIKQIKKVCSQIITFSHFVPRQELCPEKRMLFYPKLPKIIGSESLEFRIRSIHGVDGSGSACHVFGHTHFCWDAVIDGVRYVQAPLAYPRERKRMMNGGEDWLPFCIYSGGKLSDRISPCYWSDYYSFNPRTPRNTQLAPWVARFYNRT
nr:acyl-carrier-protein phosphodiesterase PptH-like isoform X3 [Ziziphus jujuba var. spinosa]